MLNSTVQRRCVVENSLREAAGSSHLTRAALLFNTLTCVKTSFLRERELGGVRRKKGR